MERVPVDAESVKSAMARQAYAYFGEKYPEIGVHEHLYKESQPQMLERPALLFEQVQVENRKRMGPRWQRQYRMRVHVLPLLEEGRPAEFLDRMGFLLFDAFRRLALPGGMVAGRGMEYQKETDVGHFAVSYTVQMVEQEEGPVMNRVELELGL